MQQSIDISWLPGPQQQIRRSSVRQMNDGTDRQTDRQMLDSFIDRSQHTKRAVSLMAHDNDDDDASHSENN